MLLWISFALLAAAVATALLRNAQLADAPAAENPDLAVYRDQLAELESDAERGVIDPSQAAAARAEVARRLLKQSAAASVGGKATKNAVAQTASADNVLLASVVAVPILSLALYLAVGSPMLPGRPLTERLAQAPDRSAPDDMIAKVEARLREKPDDGQGWAVIAPVYMTMGRAQDAAQAYARAIQLVGETPDRLLGFAKANMLANDGLVNETARKAFARLLELDPGRIEARYWLGVFEEQNGRSDAAAAVYLELLKGAPVNAPWRKPVQDRLAGLTGKAAPPTGANSGIPGGFTPPVLAPAANAATGAPSGSSAGPSPAEFVAAAKNLAPEMREQMIGRMVAKATAAIKDNPKDLSAWSRLVTGQAALGKSGDAQAALKEAKLALAGGGPALVEMDALGKSLGLTP